MIHQYDIWAPARTPASMDVFAADLPSLGDVSSVTMWGRDPPRCARVISQGPCDVDGCIHVHKGALALPDRSDPLQMPVVTMLEDLFVVGWIDGRDSALAHNNAADKTMFLDAGFAKSPLYFLCLRRLDELIELGLPSQQCMQRNACYDAAMHAAEKTQVLPGLRVAD